MVTIAMSEFVHLHLHTDYSLLDGACGVDGLVKRVAEIGQKAVADAEMTLRMLPIPNQEFADALHKRARELGLMVQA